MLLMDKLLEAVAQQASSAASTAASEEQLDEVLFQQFMSKNPVWSFYSLSKEQYMAKGQDDKLALIRQYYYEMKNGEQQYFIILLFGKCR